MYTEALFIELLIDLFLLKISYLELEKGKFDVLQILLNYLVTLP